MLALFDKRLAVFLAVSPLEIGDLDWDVYDHYADMLRAVDQVNAGIQRHNDGLGSGGKYRPYVEL
jgi:hypothetical protein